MFTVSSFHNMGLRIQCAMMLDEFPPEVTKQIEAHSNNLSEIETIISNQGPKMIHGYFSSSRNHEERIVTISNFIHAFFSYRKSIGK